MTSSPLPKKTTLKKPKNLSNEEKLLEEVKKDFRKFAWLVWKHINLPEPTPLQYDIANYLQNGPNRIVIMAFRGVGKSFITSAYALWELLRNPQIKILVVSASKSRADAFSTFTLRLIEEMPILASLRPKEGQRASRIEFDVGPAIADQSPSVRSVGINSQIAGSRADIIIADDIEIPNNSATADMREKLIEKVKEFSAVIKPLPTAKIIYLGTPQTEDSIYNKLADTFEIRIWPARMPDEKQLVQYGNKLAPYIKTLPYPPSAPTDPKRFHEQDLALREADYGKAGFALQFMLNTQLSDTERYPLKIRDLVIMDTHPDNAPMRVDWLPAQEKEIKGLPNLAMAGDRFYTFWSASTEITAYTGSVLAIDPSGRGKDETGYAVVKMLNGFLYVRKCGGLPGGYEYSTLKQLADIAKAEKVNKVIVEANFGDGMYTELIKPVLAEVHPCQVEEIKSNVQKERRIIDTLEPVMARHKLIFDKQVIEDDFKTAQMYEADNKYTKCLVYQMTRISYEKGALKHDDRLDALAMACAYWAERMAIDANKGINKSREEALDMELRKFMDNATGRRSADPGKKWVRIYGR